MNEENSKLIKAVIKDSVRLKKLTKKREEVYMHDKTNLENAFENLQTMDKVPKHLYERLSSQLAGFNEKHYLSHSQECDEYITRFLTLINKK